LKHSFSAAYFNNKFATEGIADSQYQNFELETMEQLPKLLQQQPHLVGLNVTIPYKKEVLAYLNEVDAAVQEIGACNCIKIKEGKLHGFNTDYIGFTHSLQQHLQPKHKKALVLGTGGSSVAVQYALRQLGIAYKRVSRQKGAETFSYEEINDAVLNEHLLVINTTPLGMFPNVGAAPDLPYNALTREHLLFDLVYNPEKTLFLQKGEEKGAAICNGHQMLVLQAEAAWKVWNKG
jgi:shikimate dehydrogenase